eukprot:4668395-Alexandrium_andersonii.AAC.1
MLPSSICEEARDVDELLRKCAAIRKMVKHVLRDAPRPDMSLRDPLKMLDRLEQDATKTLQHHLEQRREDPNVPVL